MGSKKIQENVTPPKVNSHTTKNLMDSERDETSISKLKKIMIRMVKEVKEGRQN
jgi:hypothetical protein